MTKKLGWSGRNSARDALRARSWLQLEGSGAVVGSAWDSTPDFAAADIAAERLCQLPFWQSASVIRSNPDAPHIPVRPEQYENIHFLKCLREQHYQAN